MLLYVPTGTSFISSNVCNPLKRAKSTVGEPLSNCTVLPLPSVAVMLCTCTEKDVTLAIGASVPTTNDDPVTASELAEEFVIVALHPARRRAPAANPKRDRETDAARIFECM